MQFVSGLFKYAQEFVETLERTVDADEVLFVCAFAIYQNEVQSMRSAKQDNVPMSIISCVLVSSLQDGAGPTVSQQIGASMNSSPFGRVLKNIQVFLDSYLCISKVSATVFVLAGASSRGRLVVVATWHFTPATRWEGRNSPKSQRKVYIEIVIICFAVSCTALFEGLIVQSWSGVAELSGLGLLVALEIFMVSQLLCGGVPGPGVLFVLATRMHVFFHMLLQLTKAFEVEQAKQRNAEMLTVHAMNVCNFEEEEEGTLCGGWREAGKGTCLATRWVPWLFRSF